MRQLRLYYRQDCHLCEQLLAQLDGLRRNREFSLQMIDVDLNPSELSAYLTRIPVLESSDGDCLSEYFLNEDALLNYLDGG